MKEKTRNEVAEQDKWDLSTVYPSDEALNKDFEMIKKQIPEFAKLENTFLHSAEKLYQTLKFYYDINIILEKMWTFTSHRYDTDLTNSSNQAWQEKINNLFNEFSTVSSFMTPKLLEFGYAKVKAFYQEKPQLKTDYGFILEQIFRQEAHTLSLKEEKLISSLSKAMSNTSQIATMLTDSDIDYGTIIDEEGKKVKLTNTNYTMYILSKDRNVRKNAFKTFYKAYKQFNNTLALSLAAFVDKCNAYSKVRKFASPLEAALFEDNVSPEVYNNLIDTVSQNLEPLYKYYKIKQNILKLDEFHLYDVYVEVANENSTKYTFERGKTLVMEALQVLGPDYLKILQKAFAERWIDIYPNKGKRDGAYSGGSYLTNPFVLLNFNETYHDVSTIAHELGHSLHTYYSNQNNPYQYSDYKIFVAEVASQVNELLFSHYMLNKVNTKQEKLDILNQILDLFKGSIYRQTMFAEFEKIISTKCQNGEILTADVLNDTYYDLVKKYFGPDVIIDDEIKYEWERIPHFYYNFYVYKYSTGLAAACHIVKRILANEKGALESYLSFLKSGGRDYPLNELKIAGVDLTKPEVIQSAMDMFKEYLKEFENLLDS